MTPDLRNHHDSEDRGEHICSKVVRAGKRTYFIANWLHPHGTFSLQHLFKKTKNNDILNY